MGLQRLMSLWQPFHRSTVAAASTALLLSACQVNQKPSEHSILISYTKLEATQDGVTKSVDREWLTHSPSAVNIGKSRFEKPEDPGLLILLKKGMTDTYGRYLSTGIATPTLITEWSTLDGTTHSHWFIVLDGEPYWQWSITNSNFNEPIPTPIWLEPSDVEIIFPDVEIFEHPSITPVTEPLLHQRWELFDGETMEPIQDPEKDWLLQRSPAEALGLTENIEATEEGKKPL